MKIDIIHFDLEFLKIDGSYAGIFDLFFNLRKHLSKQSLNLNIISKNFANLYFIFSDNNLKELTKCITHNIEYETDVAFTLYSTFILGNLAEIPKVKCKKLMIIGTMDVFEYPFNTSRIPPNWKYDELHFLNNPPCYHVTPYFHKLSEYRLNRLTKLSIPTELNYCRLDKPHILKNGHYFENIGKLIFENCYYNRPVYYNADGLTKTDGLIHYLNLFGIDGTKSQTINITRDEIKSKLFMKKSDLILELI